MMDIAEQYRIAIESAGYVDVRSRGRLHVTGNDAVSFLHALLTNDIASLQPGFGCHAAYLTPQGRMLADLDVYRRPDGLMCAMEAAIAPTLAAKWDQLLFAEDVQIADVSASTVEVVVTGARAVAAVADATGCSREQLLALAELDQADWSSGFVARDAGPVPTFRLVTATSERDALLGRLQTAGTSALSEELLDIMRIELARPRFGVDMTDETIPLEAGLLDRAISTTKGCYVGQEVIIRVLHRGGGRVARRLVQLSFERTAKEVPSVGTPIGFEGRDIGRITSAVWSPRLERIMALGYVAREVAEEGRILSVGSQSATITTLAG
jgi:folate-binding protein YgfZ